MPTPPILSQPQEKAAWLEKALSQAAAAMATAFAKSNPNVVAEAVAPSQSVGGSRWSTCLRAVWSLKPTKQVLALLGMSAPNKADVLKETHGSCAACSNEQVLILLDMSGTDVTPSEASDALPAADSMEQVLALLDMSGTDATPEASDAIAAHPQKGAALVDTADNSGSPDASTTPTVGSAFSEACSSVAGDTLPTAYSNGQVLAMLGMSPADDRHIQRHIRCR